MRRLLALLAGEGSTGAGGAGGAAGGAAGTEQGTAGAAGAGGAAGAAGAGAAGAGTGGAAGAAGAGAGAGSFAAAATGANGQQGQGAQGAAGQTGAADAPYELTLPEGVSDVDKPVFEALGKFAKESKVDQKVAQGLVDLIAKQTSEQNKAVVARLEQEAKDRRQSLEKHPRIGGTELAKSLEVAKRGINALNRTADGLGTRIGTKLQQLGFGDDPDFAELLVMVGRSAAEDGTGKTTGAAGPKPDAQAERRSKLFPNATAEGKREQQK
jgi:hypothetical protein